MKKNIYYFLSALLLTVSSCVDYNDATQPLQATSIRLVKPSVFVDNSGLANQSITLKAADRTLTVTTDAEGKATLDNLTPDVYDISAAWSISSEEYEQLTGGQAHALSSSHHLTVSGTLSQQLIAADQDIELAMMVNEDQDIIIGKIYFATSRDNNKKNYEPGRYIELYNQADDTVDVSGLYIGLVEAESTQAYTLANLHEQYNDSVVLLKQIFRIPADKPFKVKPGGTVLLVNSAIDHTQMNTTLEADLSHADFEAKDNSSRYTNNPDVPALEVTYSYISSISYLNMLNNGLCGVVIFKTDEDVSSWPLTYKYPNTATSGLQWKVMPKRYILDGVECLTNRADIGPDLSTKRLYPEIDASCTHIDAISGRTGEVVYRKTSERTGADGHKLLIDTNNSSNDFKVSTTIKPGEYDELTEN